MPLLQILQIRTAKSTGVDGPPDGSQAFAGSQTQTAGAGSASVMVAVRSGRWQMAAGAWHTTNDEILMRSDAEPLAFFGEEVLRKPIEG